VRRALAVLVVAFAAAAPAPAPAADSGPQRWPDAVPAGSPFEESAKFSGTTFTGRHTRYTVSDTYYPSWAADGKLYTGFMDGACNQAFSYGGGFGNSPYDNLTGMGTAVISGDDPLSLSFQCGMLVEDRTGYDGRYHSATLFKDGVWYYGSYLLDHAPQPGAKPCNNYCTLGPFVGWNISRDGGLSFTKAPAAKPLFGETTDDGRRVKLGALHVVDFGQEMEHSPDGKLYLVGHGASSPTSQNTWVNGDEVYLVRTTPSPETINDARSYEYFAGRDAEGRAIWSRRFEDIRPLLSWPGRLGSATITYDAPLKTYLMWVTTPTDGVNTTGRYDSMLLEADAIGGPWRMVHYLPRFGPQAYFLTSPSKFISDDGRKLWVTYSANYNNTEDPPGTEDPAGSGYAWVLRELTLDEGTPAALPSSPGGGGSPPAGCADRARPRTTVGAVRASRGALAITGRARDRGCAGVARVRISISRRLGGRRCRFVVASGRLGSVRSCRRPVYVAARGTERWVLTRRLRLGPGRYVVRVHAVDARGNAEGPRRANRRIVRVG
jgi:hypothetical protein